mmetsp:Transcript_143106/g.274902  ORF Transcript_143106/g.274902 Transcript_143106/m.274902 type:complete len:940 (+) Transcript_143106:79-2898(+)
MSGEGGYTLLKMNEPPEAGTSLLQMTTPDMDTKTAQSKKQSDPRYGQDVVQFFNPFFFADEDKGLAVATVMRLGALKETCTIEFHTIDASAIAGRNYMGTQGTITFEPREELKQIEIEIYDNPWFDSNLDFRLTLENPENCIQSNVLQGCRIMIRDNDVFPSNEFRDKIGTPEMHEVGIRMLIAFVVFCVKRIPLVGWRTYWNLFLDQFHNANYLWTIWLNVYLVDVVFNLHPEAEERLWVQGPTGRLWTAGLVALGQILPKFLLSLIDYYQVGELAVAGKVKLHLKVNLFRRYLYYSSASHHRVSAQEMYKNITDDVDEVVALGFMVIFKFSQQLVQVCVILYFLIHKKPLRAALLIVYPIIMACALNLRYKRSLELQESLRVAEIGELSCMRYSFEDMVLIKEYNRRGAAVKDYEGCVKAAMPHMRAHCEYDFRTMQVSPWITNIAISLFTVVGGYYVINGDLSLGAFLASVGMYKDAGGIFAGFYTMMKGVYSVIGPFLRVVTLMNLSTDIHHREKQDSEKVRGVMDQFAEMDQMGQIASYTPVNRFDMLNIRLVDVSLHLKSLQSISVSLPQGRLVAVLGSHDTGKFSLLKLLRGTLLAKKRGFVQVPSHLTAICVPRTPQILHNYTLVENLTYGSDRELDRGHLLKLCRLVKLHHRSIDMIEAEFREKFGAANTEARLSPRQEKMMAEAEAAAYEPWHQQISHTDLSKMTLVRAFYNNPELLLLQRPADEMEADHAAQFLNTLREYVDNRGFAFNAEEIKMARPRTVLFTTGQDRERAEFASDVADVVWNLSLERGFTQKEGGAAKQEKTEHSGNKVVSSWSRHAKHLEHKTQELSRELEHERQFCEETKKKVELYSTRVLVAQEESDQAQDLLFQVQHELQALEQDQENQEATSFFGCVDSRASKERLHNLNAMLADATAGDGNQMSSREAVD